MDDMAVDSDEEVDYSKMDQVWSWKDGWGFLGQLLFSTCPFPHSQKICVSFTGRHLPSAALVGSAALWDHVQLHYFKVAIQNQMRQGQNIFLFIFYKVPGFHFYPRL